MHISDQLNKYKGLSMAQFNHIKANDIQDFELVGDLSDENNDIVTYINDNGEKIAVFTNGDITK
jgi:hypothetical protein